ncbi:DUF559 domain-containing protein [Patescibacteria group bacterium]|nr:DUF559 domain-containing protein [Patescibacteria group bacterium]MBU4308956.1 DUF559 domain-containing protein [Patescibacteria group bacterium]MBU4431873.1 DUF559 domain-containing protein [Patescibacteria group bacterium]MBU4577316.1 DUF559 domain-containing protein [Patescibacteria group bacterium]
MRKILRRQPNTCELILWERIRDRQLDNFKFKRQCSIGKYEEAKLSNAPSPRPSPGGARESALANFLLYLFKTVYYTHEPNIA